MPDKIEVDDNNVIKKTEPVFTPHDHFTVIGFASKEQKDG